MMMQINTLTLCTAHGSLKFPGFCATLIPNICQNVVQIISEKITLAAAVFNTTPQSIAAIIFYQHDILHGLNKWHQRMLVC